MVCEGEARVEGRVYVEIWIELPECALGTGKGQGQHFSPHRENRTGICAETQEVPIDGVSTCDPACKGIPGLTWYLGAWKGPSVRAEAAAGESHSDCAL